MFGNFFQSKTFTFLAIGAIFVLAVALLRIQPQRVVVEKKMINFQDKIAELEKSNSELGRLLGYFKSDAYLEKEAKLKLNVRRPEESVVFFHEGDVNPTGSPQELALPHQGEWGFFANWGQWFRDLIN
jgi:cell division protein FtsB